MRSLLIFIATVAFCNAAFGQCQSGDAVAFNDEGARYSMVGVDETAVKCFEHSVKLSPIYPIAYYNLGTAYFHIGQ